MISPDPNIKYISASEISDYVYSQSHETSPSDQAVLDAGTQKHNEMYQSLVSFENRNTKIVLTLILFIIIYLVFAIFLL